MNLGRVASFLGSLMTVPDATAASFPSYVYRHLIEGETVAIALHLARIEFLHDLRNPLGLAYSIFGSADTVLPCPVGVAATGSPANVAGAGPRS